MSRSCKKTPCCHIVKKDPWYKRWFNRRLRRRPVDWAEGVSSMPDGGAYRRANESWLIDDWSRLFVTFEESSARTRDQYERWYTRK